MAEVAVCEMLKEIAAKTLVSHGHCKLSASDFMDDGSCIRLTIDIDPTEVSDNAGCFTVMQAASS